MCVLLTVFCVLSVNSDSILNQEDKEKNQEWYCKPQEACIGGSYGQIFKVVWYCKPPKTSIGGSYAQIFNYIDAKVNSVFDSNYNSNLCINLDKSFKHSFSSIRAKGAEIQPVKDYVDYLDNSNNNSNRKLVNNLDYDYVNIFVSHLNRHFPYSNSNRKVLCNFLSFLNRHFPYSKKVLGNFLSVQVQVGVGESSTFCKKIYGFVGTFWRSGSGNQALFVRVYSQSKFFILIPIFG